MSKKLVFINSSSKELKIIYGNGYLVLASKGQNDQSGEFDIVPGAKIKFGNKDGVYIVNSTILDNLVPAGGRASIIVYDENTTSLAPYGSNVMIGVNTSTGEIQSTTTSGQVNTPGLVSPLSIIDNFTGKVKNFLSQFSQSSDATPNIDPVIPQQVNNHMFLIIFLVILVVVLVLVFGAYWVHKRNSY